MISEVHFHTDPTEQYVLCIMLGEDGEYISFWNDDYHQALARASWIRDAYDAPFIIEP